MSYSCLSSCLYSCLSSAATLCRICCVLQRVAACCSVLQCVAVFELTSNEAQIHQVALCCSVLPCLKLLTSNEAQIHQNKTSLLVWSLNSNLAKNESVPCSCGSIVYDGYDFVGSHKTWMGASVWDETLRSAVALPEVGEDGIYVHKYLYVYLSMCIHMNM